jgi:hypothetical protein
MDGLVRRPRASFGPENGFLRTEHFQMAYTTNDIERACDIFSERFGIKSFRRLEGQLPAGGQIRIELAWVGTMMYELMTASGPGSAIYIDRLPPDEFAIKHHHLGFLIHNAAQWDALEVEAKRAGRPLLNMNKIEGFMQICFVDIPELGHYFEYIFPEPAGIDFFENVPGN